MGTSFDLLIPYVALVTLGPSGRSNRILGACLTRPPPEEIKKVGLLVRERRVQVLASGPNLAGSPAIHEALRRTGRRRQGDGWRSQLKSQNHLPLRKLDAVTTVQSDRCWAT